MYNNDTCAMVVNILYYRTVLNGHRCTKRVFFNKVLARLIIYSIIHMLESSVAWQAVVQCQTCTFSHSQFVLDDVPKPDFMKHSFLWSV